MAGARLWRWRGPCELHSPPPPPLSAGQAGPGDRTQGETRGPAVSSLLMFDARASLVDQSVAYESTVASMAPGGLQYL